MRFHWLLPSTLSIFLLSSPAEAAKLKFWRFDAHQNRLDLKTDASVQPKAQLIFNPTRLVIDLPGTTLEHPTVKQQFGGSIRSIRVGQFDGKTTRLVIELSPGYRLDPQQVKFRGASPSQWTVHLPTPQKMASLLPTRSLRLPQSLGQGLSASSPKKVSSAQVAPGGSGYPDTTLPLGTVASPTGAVVQVEKVQVTGDGFFIRTRGGGNPQLQVNRSSDRATINIEISGATLSPSLAGTDLAINRYGVNHIQLAQVQTSPPVVRMTMRVNQNSPDWQPTVSSLGGVVLLPGRGIAAATVVNTTTQPERGEFVSASPLANQPPGVARIQSVELARDGKQLLIRADQPLTYTSGWNRATALYRITINNAQIARSIKGPSLNASSPILRVRLQQSDPSTVVILVQPASGVRVGELNQPGVQLLSLQLQRSSVALLPPSMSAIARGDAESPSPAISRPIVVPPPSSPTPPPPISSSIPAPAPSQPPPQPRPPKGRLVVIVDPGHGGKDPGAIGLGGLQEKDVILAISQQVAALLQQQGVQVVMTRNNDYFVDLQPRVAMAERVNADLFVSIHANSMPANRSDISGLETYYFESGQRLARTIHNSVLQNVNIKDRGVRRARFYVLRKSSMPSVLVEVGFVTGFEDAPRLGTSAYQNQMAAAIARGVLQYIQQNF